MAVGRLTTKWRIFRRNLDFSLENNAKICQVAARLHNFVIDNNNLKFQNTLVMAEVGVEPMGDREQGYLPSETDEDVITINSSQRRNAILAGIEERELL